VKKVFAPPPRAEKAYQIPTAKQPVDEIAEAAMSEIFKRQPAVEADLMRYFAGQ
jgi:electron transfer flavoprotein beta subunit